MQQKVNGLDVRWKRIEVNAYSNMLSLSKTQKLNLTLANKALKESLSNWYGEYDVDGSWLMKLKRENKDKGVEFEKILKSMCFQKEIKNSLPQKSVIISIPIALSLICGVISIFAGFGLIKRIIAAALPSIVLIPVLNSYWDTKNKETTKKIIKSYIGQLEEYRNQLVDILEK